MKQGIQADNEQVKSQLLCKVAQEFQNNELTVITPGSGRNSKPLGMCRIIDVNRLLSLYAIQNQEKTFTVIVQDKYAAWNQKCYLIKNGKCTQIESGKPDFNVSINLLTRLLFGYRIRGLPVEYHLFEEKKPEMSLMME